MDIPREIGGFELGRRLGEGALAEVYEGVHRRSGKKRAFKLLKRDLAAHPESAQILIDEAAKLSRIRTPRVVAVLDAGEADGRFYVALEHLDGPTLARRLEGPAPLEPGAALLVLEGLLEAIAGVHEAGVVHCEVEPANVYLLGAGGSLDVRLAGFSQSRRAGEEGERGVERAFAPFCAPEQAEGRHADPSFDVFSAGVVAHRMISGNAPRPAWQLQGSLPPLGARTPAAVAELVTRMANVDPIERPDARDALLQTAQLRGRPRPPQEPRRSLWSRLFKGAAS